MDKLCLCPTDAYSVDPPADEVIRQQLDGGAGRYRLDKIGGTSIAHVTWALHINDYQYLYAFFRAKTANGSQPFLIDLILDGYPREERTVQFLPNTLSLTGKFRSRFFTVTAQLEVWPADVDEDFDNSIVDIYEATGGNDIDGYLNLLNLLVNVNWPEAS